MSAYDETLAQRIRWKWRAVLDALPVSLGELPTTIIDWGCGTGGASRELLARDENQNHFKKVLPLDRSTRAVQFASRKIQAEFPTVERLTREGTEPFILLISHVFSELPPEELQKLLPLLKRARYVLWVESGRRMESRRLSALREDLRVTHEFLAPCPHQGVCGMLAPDQEENWCHFKAPVPKDVHHSAFWRECSKQLGFDLRSLPVAYLFAGQKRESTLPDDQVRVLAGSRQFKGYTRYHGCHKSGVYVAEFMKRHSKSLYESLAEPELDSLYSREQLLLKETSDGPL
ncbi:MAG: hypothetical protein EOP10_29030 [Proteobacteria bacterium]|nr:MAG: hypothetical protein EOP10_29030 [Pseudomonadota bacterium]